MKKKTECVHIDEELVRIARELRASILNAAWLTDAGQRNLHRPTPHMETAIAELEAYCAKYSV